MATEVLMPRQGQSVESCLILEWRKKEGEPVKAGEILCEVETDKAAFEVEAPEDGVLLKILRPRGAEVPVLEPIAFIGRAGEKIPHGAAAAAPAAPAERTGPAAGASAEAARVSVPAAPPPAAPVAPPASVSGHAAPAVRAAGTTTGLTAGLAPGSKPGLTAGLAAGADPGARPGTGKASPRARRLAAARGLSLEGVSGTGPGGRIVEKDVLAVLEAREPLSPAAAAALAGDPVGGLEAPARGSGPGGRVALADLVPRKTPAAGPVPAAGTSAATASGPGAAAAADFPGPVEEIPVRSVRKLIAERMLSSLMSHAQLTLHSGADARVLLGFRKRLKDSPQDSGLSGITLNDLVLYAVSRVLPLFPEMNAHWLGDRILRFRRVHLGFAVDTPRGLLVPVIRNADLLPLRRLSTEAKRLARACLEGRISPEELSGGTFTVTNLGALGIESFTPVLNSPQLGILGVSAVTPRPVFVGEGGEGVEFVPTLGLSLTIDHQGVDGAPGARFLKELAETIARFDLILAKG